MKPKISAKMAGRIGFQTSNFYSALETYRTIQPVSALSEKAFWFCSGVAETEDSSFEEAWELFVNWRMGRGNFGAKKTDQE